MHFFTSKPYKAEMCLWDNLGNSTDLHWEASIGQVSLPESILGILDSSPREKFHIKFSRFQDAFWKGGPRIDKTDGSVDGGPSA